MAKTFATLFGIVYVLMGAIGFFNTGLVGTAGVFAADGLTSAFFVLVGAALLVGATAASRTRNTNTIVGAVLALLAVIGFLAVPDRGELLGMLVSGSVHWFNLIAGAILFGTGVFERRTVDRYAYSVS